MFRRLLGLFTSQLETRGRETVIELELCLVLVELVLFVIIRLVESAIIVQLLQLVIELGP